MNITAVRFRLMPGQDDDRLKAFCSITVDDEYVIRDMKIIRGNEALFVAMPSRKILDRCHACSMKNALQAKFCSNCGVKLRENRGVIGHNNRMKYHEDTIHPITTECRDLMQAAILGKYAEELELAKQPGYTCNYEDY